MNNDHTQEFPNYIGPRPQKSKFEWAENKIILIKKIYLKTLVCRIKEYSLHTV